MALEFKGVFPAPPTPTTEDGRIHEKGLRALLEDNMAHGAHGFWMAGTTGEGPSFTVAERRAAIDGLIAGGVPAGRILVSTSCAALPDAVELTRHAVDAGCFGCLLLPPFFLKGVPDQGIIDAYRWVIDGVADPRLRIVLYHIPQVSGVGLSHHVIRTLKGLYPETIVGIKDSSGQRAGSLAYADAFMPAIQVWVGNEPDQLVMSARGSNGAVSGVANVLPRLIDRLVTQHAGPDAARDAQRVQAFIDVLGGYGMTAAFKGVMAILDDDAGWRRVRPPLVALSDAEFERLAVQMRAFAVDRERD